MVINPIVGVYIPIIRIPIKGWMTIPNTRSLDPGSYTYIFLPLAHCFCCIFASLHSKKERRDHECSLSFSKRSQAIWTLCEVRFAWWCFTKASHRHTDQTDHCSKRQERLKGTCKSGVSVYSSGRSFACSAYNNIQYTWCKWMWIVYMWGCAHMSAVYTADLPSP